MQWAIASPSTPSLLSLLEAASAQYVQREASLDEEQQAAGETRLAQLRIKKRHVEDLKEPKGSCRASRALWMQCSAGMTSCPLGVPLCHQN